MRRLARSPGSTLAALSVLTLGLGSTVTVYTVARAVLLKDLPLENPHHLVAVERSIGGEVTLMHSPADLLDLRERGDVFSAVSASAGFRSLLSGPLESSYVRGASVTPEYFETLGATPSLGETFPRWGDRPDVVVLSRQLWQRLGADRAIVGKSIILDGEPYRVVGVMPKDLAFLNTDLWVPGPQGLPRPPFPIGPELRVRRDLAYVTILGRLATGWDPVTARAAVEAAGRGIVENYPADYPEVRFSITPLKDLLVGDSQNQLMVLSAGVAMVFLLVCLGVAGLLVGRSISRSDDDAVRLALGASRAQALAGGLTDSLVLATVGGVLGTLASIRGVHLFLSLAPAMPRSEEASLDATVLLFAVGATLGASLLAGALPALKMIRSHPGPILVSSGKRPQSRGRKLAWTTLLILEVGLMVMFLVGSLMLNRDLLRLRAVDLGFKPEGLLVASVQLPRQRYAEPGVVGFFDELLTRLAAVPETEAVGAALVVPAHEGKVGRNFSIVGRAAESGTPSPTAWFSVVSPGYFRTLGMQILAGRGFATEARAGSVPVAVVNQAMAARYWRNENPLGAELIFGDDDRVRIIGVVSDIRHSLFDAETEPRVYRPYPQEPWHAMSVVVRSQGNLAGMIPAVRRVVREIDPGQPLPTITFMEDSLAEFLRPTRYLFLILGGFAVLAVVITTVGLYGMLTLRVQEEEHDLAIRLALGAPRVLLVRTQLTRGLLIAAAGVALGTVGAIAAKPLLERISPATEGSNLALLSLVAFLSVMICGVSSLIPARHVLKLDPSRVGRNI